MPIPAVALAICFGSIATFHSELYNEIENDSRFKKANEIYKGKQIIFIIYKLE